MHEVNDRARLIRDRLIARRISRNPEMVAATKALLPRSIAHNSSPEWWVLEWLEILNWAPQDVAAFVRSTDQHSRRLINCSPFRDEVTGLGLSDDERRRKLLSKAIRSVVLIPMIPRRRSSPVSALSQDEVALVMSSQMEPGEDYNLNDLNAVAP